MSDFILDIQLDAQPRGLTLRLTDAEGHVLGTHSVELDAHMPPFWEGIMDLRRHMGRFDASPKTPESPDPRDIVKRLGVFLGREVLGTRNLAALLAPDLSLSHLAIRLPPGDEALCGAIARIPWEMARPSPMEASLGERGLTLRLVPSGLPLATPDTPSDDRALRVLLVFPQVPGWREPRVFARDRDSLLDWFRGGDLDRQDVEVDLIGPLVTRDLLLAQVQARGGHDIVHWGGPLAGSALVLVTPDGLPDPVPAADLMAILRAGGVAPRLVVLGASPQIGAFLPESPAAIRGFKDPELPALRAAPSVDEILARSPGQVEAASALCAAGVAQVVAARCALDGDYATGIATRFYRQFLTDAESMPLDQALSWACHDMAERQPMPRAVDHANALAVVAVGHTRVHLDAPWRKSAPPIRRTPWQMPPGSRFNMAMPPRHVSRARALDALRTGWLAPDGAPLAIIAGPAGCGKTTLAAEALGLWRNRFDGVFITEAWPVAPNMESVYRCLDRTLRKVSDAYRLRVQAKPFQRAWLPEEKGFHGEGRHRKLCENVVHALKETPILWLLDHFDAFQGESLDPEWERLLQLLNTGLRGTGSRVLVTWRNPSLDAFQASPEPLLPTESIYLASPAALVGLDEALLGRLLGVAAGNPQVVEVLGPFGWDPEALTDELDRLDALPLDSRGRAAVRMAIARLSPPARLMYWMLSLSDGPVTEDMMSQIWAGGTAEGEMEAWIQGLSGVWHDMFAAAPADLDRTELPTEIRALGGSQATPTGPNPIPRITEELLGLGLLNAISTDGSWTLPEWGRDGILTWMDAHPEDRAGRDTETVLAVWADRSAIILEGLLRAGITDLSLTAIRGTVGIFLRARGFEALSNLSTFLLRSVAEKDPEGLVLQEILDMVDGMAPGPDRQQVRVRLADTLIRVVKPKDAVEQYQLAANEALLAGDGAASSHILQHQATAMVRIGLMDDARKVFLQCADVRRRTGRPKVEVIGAELEAARIPILKGDVQGHVSEITTRLQNLRELWRRHKAGEELVEAPDVEFLGRVLVGALDLAGQANLALNKWQIALDLLEEMDRAQAEIGASEHDRAVTRMNFFNPLVRMGRGGDAEKVVQACLEVFKKEGDLFQSSRALGALATLYALVGNMPEAIHQQRQALALAETIADPEGRAMSHQNMAAFLEGANQEDEARMHQVASVIYRMGAGLHMQLGTNARFLIGSMRKAQASKKAFTIPQVAELLGRPEYGPLKEYLEGGGVALDQVQAAFDQFMNQVRQQAQA